MGGGKHSFSTQAGFPMQLAIAPKTVAAFCFFLCVSSVLPAEVHAQKEN
jgi:hypothetical protein